MHSFDNSIQQIFSAYNEAVYQKDVEAFIKLYDLDVRVFDTWGVWSYKGEPAWRKMIEQWFGSLGNERVKVKFDVMQATAEQSLGTVCAVVTYMAISPNGEALRQMQNRLTWVLKQKEGLWKITHEHTSVPVDFNNMKAMLQCDEV